MNDASITTAVRASTIVDTHLIMSHDVARVRGPNHPYRARRFDWRPVFAELSNGSPPPSILAVANSWHLPYDTVRKHWRMYQRAVATNDETAFAIACGDVDGRRDNARKITREEEAEIRARIDQENVHPNKPVIQRVAIAVHNQHAGKTTPASSTRSQSHGQPSPFTCGSSTVERLKHEWALSSQAPKLQKRYIKDDAARQEAKLDEAIRFIDDVHKSVLRNGARFVINADEMSSKVIKMPFSVLAPRGAERPPIIRSNRSHKDAFTMIFATTASGTKLLPAVVIPADKGPRAMQPYDRLTHRAVLLRGQRWYGRELWTEYIERVIVPYCGGHPATFVVDSYTPHLHDLPIDTAVEHDIATVQVPARQTAELQPNDVKVYGPLSSAVRKAWLEQLRVTPEVNDSIPLAIERYLDAWDALKRETVIHAWKEAVPLLTGLRNHVGTVDE